MHIKGFAVLRVERVFLFMFCYEVAYPVQIVQDLPKKCFEAPADRIKELDTACVVGNFFLELSEFLLELSEFLLELSGFLLKLIPGRLKIK